MGKSIRGISMHSVAGTRPNPAFTEATIAVMFFSPWDLRPSQWQVMGSQTGIMLPLHACSPGRAGKLWEMFPHTHPPGRAENRKLGSTWTWSWDRAKNKWLACLVLPRAWRLQLQTMMSQVGALSTWEQPRGMWGHAGVNLQLPL